MVRRQRHPKRHDRPGVDRYGRTALHYAALTGKMAEVHRLLAEGAAADAKDDDGWTAMHAAAQGGHVEVVKALLDAGASVNSQDSHGNTPLSTAVFNSKGDGGLIAVFRQAGADPHKANNYGVSPLTLARSIGNFDVAQFFADLPT